MQFFAFVYGLPGFVLFCTSLYLSPSSTARSQAKVLGIVSHQLPQEMARIQLPLAQAPRKEGYPVVASPIPIRKRALAISSLEKLSAEIPERTEVLAPGDST